MSRLTKFLGSFFVISLLIAFSVPGNVSALSGSDFKAGRIIDDAIFYNNNDMSTSDIQSFLNSKVPTCDTSGSKLYSGSQTRAQYGASKGYPAPYICLKTYSERGLSSAQIIKSASDSYRLNPKALLVLLQKEQTLVTDDWPWSNQYRSATGYGCPDTAPCDAEYYGLYNQVMNAAKQFRRYADTPSSYRYKPNQSNFIQYNPTSSCGGSDVYIENYATAGLYNYTPYQPNQSSLVNLYGLGDSCGAYGNRNFWRLYSDWFGSTIGGCTPNEVTLPQVHRLYNPVTFEHFYSSLQCEINLLTTKHGFQSTGASFNTTNAGVPWAVPVYRNYNPARQLHFWTTSLAESNAVQQQLGYVHEGIAFYTLDPSNSTAKPVYRIYNPQTKVHFWTQSLAEADAANRYGGFRFEGIAFYNQ